MKALWHAECNTIISPKGETWTPCHCGEYACRWRDGAAGLFEITSRSGAREARILGIHNSFIQGGRDEPPLTDVGWRRHWALARVVTPDTYLFVRRESPLVVIAPGESNDTFWMPWPEGT